MNRKPRIKSDSHYAENADCTAVDEARLDGLKLAFAESLKHVPLDQDVLYLDYPVHLNIGDILILKGTEAAFADSGHHINGRFGWMNFRHSVGECIDRNTTIVFHGGGNFGDLYPVHQRFRERILGRFPHNRIVILPQTIHFSSQAELDASARIFRRHPEVVIMVRDLPSQRAARQHFSDQVHLIPDAAHYLWRLLDPPAVPDGVVGRQLQLLRKDKEAPARTFVSRLGEPATDWLELIPRWTQHLYGLVCRMHMVEGLLDCDLNSQSIWYRQSDLIVENAVRQLSQYSSIRSNRLHACLLGLLLKKQVMLLDNSYGKLRHYFDAWFRDMPGVAIRN